MTTILIGFICFGLGFVTCAAATWIRLHRQESQIRALITGIEVLQDMDDEVPPEWVIAELETMVAREDR